MVSGINGGLPIYDRNEANAQTILREIDAKSRDPLFCVEKLKSELLLFITQQRVLLYGENFEEILNVCFKNMRQVVAYKNRLIMDLDTHRKLEINIIIAHNFTRQVRPKFTFSIKISICEKKHSNFIRISYGQNYDY